MAAILRRRRRRFVGSLARARLDSLEMTRNEAIASAKGNVIDRVYGIHITRPVIERKSIAGKGVKRHRRITVIGVLGLQLRNTIGLRRNEETTHPLPPA